MAKLPAGPFRMRRADRSLALRREERRAPLPGGGTSPGHPAAVCGVVNRPVRLPKKADGKGKRIRMK